MYAEKLLEMAGKIPEREKEEFVDCINQCFRYVNTAALTSIEIEMGNGNVSEIERQNAKRNDMHNRLCESLNTINKLAEQMHVEKPFPFELEPMTKNGRFAGYSQNNHYRTSEIASVLIDELQYMGRETYRNLDKLSRVEDMVHQQAIQRNFRTQNYEQLMQSMQKYNEQHYQFDKALENLKENEAITLKLRDGSGELVVTTNDEYSISIIESTLHDKGYELYLEDEDMMQDCPKSIVRDIINEHQGFDTGKVVELEIEQEQTFDDFLKNVSNSMTQENNSEKEKAIEYDNDLER